MRLSLRRAVCEGPDGQVLSFKTKPVSASRLKALRKVSEKGRIDFGFFSLSGVRSDSVPHLRQKWRFGREIVTRPGQNPHSGRSSRENLLRMRHRLPKTEREQRKFDANFLKGAKQDNKSFVFKGRGSSVVEQPIRNRQVAGSSPALGSNSFLTT